MPTARALHHADLANDTHTPKTATPRDGHAKGSRAERAARKGPHRTGTEPLRPQGKSTALGETVAKLAEVQAKQHGPSLLIGASIGAAVALSVVALRTREKPPTIALFASPNSTFLSAIVKTAAFAVERAASKGSLAGLVARVVSKAVA